VTAAEREVLDAADRLVEAFAAHDRERYFAAFAPDATFVFYTTPEMLNSRDEWEAEWRRMESEDGFRVLTCTSTEQRVTLAKEAAVFVHRVATRAEFGGEVVVSDERETIVFRRDAGRWLAIHEHLSPFPR
jgi:uncharacterized protein (TIGR02246 family)